MLLLLIHCCSLIKIKMNNCVIYQIPIYLTRLAYTVDNLRFLKHNILICREILLLQKLFF